jgi:hypothetical protein
VAHRFTELLDTDSGLTEVQQAAIDHDNAEALLPRLA